MPGGSGGSYYDFQVFWFINGQRALLRARPVGLPEAPDISEALCLHVCINSENAGKSISQNSQIRLEIYNNLDFTHLGQTAYF